MRRARVLLDECVPRRLRGELTEWLVDTVYDIGWAGKKDGALLEAADAECEVFLTVDRRLPFQQRQGGRRLAIIVLVAYRSTFAALQPLVPELKRTLATIRPGEVIFLSA